MINKELIKKLDKWCEEVSTTFSRVFVKETKRGIIVKRYDGGISKTIQEFYNNDQLEAFLKDK